MRAVIALALVVAACSSSPEVRNAQDADQRARDLQRRGADMAEICSAKRAAARAWTEAGNQERADSAKRSAAIFCRSDE